MKKGQKHQNKTAFKVQYQEHYKQQVKSAQLDRLCENCEAQIQWKIKYGKYKVPSDLSKCQKCEKKIIRKAYRKLCDPCSDELKACSKCLDQLNDDQIQDNSSGGEEMEQLMKQMRERSKRTVQRRLDKNQIEWNKKEKCFIDCETGEQIHIQLKSAYIDEEDEDQWQNQDSDNQDEDSSSDEFEVIKPKQEQQVQKQQKQKIENKSENSSEDDSEDDNDDNDENDDNDNNDPSIKKNKKHISSSDDESDEEYELEIYSDGSNDIEKEQRMEKNFRFYFADQQ